MQKGADAMPNTFPCLDGLRGFAAIWVLLSHVQILTGGGNIPVLSWGGLAVDLFMMLSGFLMAHHYLLREAKEPWVDKTTWQKFWIRRFFRIAPLYYVLLFISLAMSPMMLAGRNSVATVWPETATLATRYAGFEFSNIATHITFLFGALPKFAFRTPLPDWSIGLEMQFYLAFPFIMLLFKRFGFLIAGTALALGCLALRLLFRDFFHQFDMPSFLPMKLYVFILGMWLAVGRASGLPKLSLYGSLAMVIAPAIYYRSPDFVGLVVLVIGIYYLISDNSLPARRVMESFIGPIRQLLSGKLSHLLGELSYGIYLVHLLVLIPVAGYLAQNSNYTGSTSAARFAICMIVVIPISMLFAWIGHRFVELPGIRLGKVVTSPRKPMTPIKQSA